jgi:hypothetical protein
MDEESMALIMQFMEEEEERLLKALEDNAESGMLMVWVVILCLLVI